MTFIKDDPNINREGRPKGSKNFTTKVREALEKIADGNSNTNEELLIQSIMEKAIVDKDTSMMRAIWEQMDGKPLQRMANADGSNISFEIVNYGDIKREIPAEGISDTDTTSV